MASLALTQRRVEKLTAPSGKIGTFKDGATRGLVLQIRRLAEKDKPPSASWLLIYTVKGKRRAMGLGSLTAFNLAEARERARLIHQQLADKVDPLAEKRRVNGTAVREQRAVTFEEAATEYYKRNEASWRSPVHRDQFAGSLRNHVFPIIGSMRVASVDRDAVLRVLEPSWTDKVVTMSRVRQRIESILAMAMTLGYRDEGLNPARWEGNLDQVLPAPGRVASIKHHAALPYQKIPQFVWRLRRAEGLPALALQLVILTAARSGEVIGAQWSEFDLAAAKWSIPGIRMKAGRPHTVPLSKQAVALLRSLPREGDLLFPSATRRDQAMSRAAMANLLKSLKVSGATIHGFRSAFADWASETTEAPAHVIEASLAHTVGNATTRAYRRTDSLAQRRDLMQQWADYIGEFNGRIRL